MEEIIFEGPLFNGRLRAEIKTALREAEHEIADHIHGDLEDEFHSKFVNSTGYYESHVTIHDSPEGVVVGDGGVVYGPWLEGTGSRNQTTRFKGYSIFRRVAEKSEATGYAIVKAAMAAVTRRG